MLTLDQVHKLPKIELHAHLTGSVRDSTVLDLLKQEANHANAEQVLVENYQINPDKTMEQCFQIFGLLHRLLKKRENLARVMREILEDFSEENTVYLELRTTPRNIYEGNHLILSKREYIETVIGEIEKFKASNDMITRLILSVDRTKGYVDALETVELCNTLKSEYVVGNPEVASFQDYRQIFKLIKDYNLKTTVHIAEVWNDPDLDFILKEVKPERIGHAVCLNKSYQAYLLSENRIPIEICPSSNLMTRLVDSIDNHPFLDFWGVDREYPLAICTDDRGMFNTSLTREQHLICSSFNFSIEDIFYLNKRAIKFIFDQSDVTLVQLKTKFDNYKNCFMKN